LAQPYANAKKGNELFNELGHSETILGFDCHILPALRLTLVCVLFFCGIYSLFIWLIAQGAPAKGEGETITVNGKVVGYALLGQSFTQDKYFWSRPQPLHIMQQAAVEVTKVLPIRII
jgi:K+-transporting ATPase c subunit